MKSSSYVNALGREGRLDELLAIRRGIEKESLRITEDGKLAQTRHPYALGSALTHPRITTDFSEALLEFITSPQDCIDRVLAELDEIHRFTYANIDDEMLWVTSMPCLLEDDDSIPVARYGNSNVAQMKTTYRIGLGHRYGRLMQTIAGIHFNFSVSDAFWDWLLRQTDSKDSLRDAKTAGYFGLIRNFHRLAWLLVYLFGASPALCRSFIGQRNHHLSPLTRGTLHAQWGTSLRMGDLGYQSSAQAGLDISYNCLEEYVETLERAIREPHPDYARIGLKNGEEYLQLSTSLLQIENEFYSAIRPKRIAHSGEAPRRALARRGVEYVEVRCIDLDPYLPLGIDRSAVLFIEIFLLHCLLHDSQPSDREGRVANRENLRRIVERGREPGLLLIDDQGARSAQQWGVELLTDMVPIAELLDHARGDTLASEAIGLQREKMEDPAKTPSARILADLTARDQPFFHFAMDKARDHRQSFLAHPLDDARRGYYDTLSSDSLRQQQHIEEADELSFDQYLERYYRQ